MKKKELLMELAVDALFAVILFLFYRAWWAFIALPPAVIIYHRYNKKVLEKKRKAELSSQFKDALISISAALRAGYSVENSITESSREMRSMYGPGSVICGELEKVTNELRLGISCENALDRMAEENGIPDMETFASVFRIAKRSGGNLVEIIKKTADDIASKADTQNEISVLISSKKFEQKIMSFMPMGIILYISLASPDLIAPLYGNALGIIIMTLALGMYGFSYFLSVKVMNIEV